MKKIAPAKSKNHLSQIEHDPRFLKRMAKARAALRSGKGIPWEEIEPEADRKTPSPK
jgi:hypothetical protein